MKVRIESAAARHSLHEFGGTDSLPDLPTVGFALTCARYLAQSFFHNETEIFSCATDSILPLHARFLYSNCTPAVNLACNLRRTCESHRLQYHRFSQAWQKDLSVLLEVDKPLSEYIASVSLLCQAKRLSSSSFKDIFGAFIQSGTLWPSSGNEVILLSPRSALASSIRACKSGTLRSTLASFVGTMPLVDRALILMSAGLQHVCRFRT